MRNRFLLLPAAALAVALATPGEAKAQGPSCVADVTLGFGGYFSGCYSSFTVHAFFENAGDVSNMYWFAGLPTRDGTTNAPTPTGSFLFDNNCGSSGTDASTGVFCVPGSGVVIPWALDAELVFGLNNLNSGSWLYSGDEPNRNSPPLPAGVQNWLWQISGGTWDGWYMFGWEDLNSGCFSALGENILDGTMLTSQVLGASEVSCTGNNGGGISDDDYNDFYVLINPLFDPPPGDVVPEPMTMSLLATGLLGMGGASLRRRKK